jgi:hypothetical protein
VLHAHEEPNKTLWEKKQALMEQSRFSKAGVSALTQWRQEMIGGDLGPPRKTIRQEYDSRGRMISISAFRNDTITASAVYSFDPAGNMVSDIDLDARSLVVEANLFHHDPEGRVTSGYALDSADHPAGRFLHVFDRTAHTIRFIKYDERDSIAYTITYTFGGDFDTRDYAAAVKYTREGDTLLAVTKVLNADGQPLEKQVIDRTANKTYSFHYSYGPLGVQSIDRNSASGALETHSVYVRDPQGLCTGIRTTDAEGKLKHHITMKYEYGYDRKEHKEHQ